MKQMKHLKVIPILFCILLGLGFFNTASAWYLELDNSDGDNSYDVWFKLDDGEEKIRIFYYGISVAFDPEEVAWIGEYTNHLPPGWEQEYYPGQRSPDSASCLQGSGNPYYDVTGDYLLGSFTMALLEGAVQDGEPDVWFPEYPYENFKYYGLMIRVPLEDDGSGGNLMYDVLNRDGHLVNGAGLDVGSAVPIPGAAWLLGAGLLGLAGIRRGKNHR